MAVKSPCAKAAFKAGGYSLSAVVDHWPELSTPIEVAVGTSLVICHMPDQKGFQACSKQGETLVSGTWHPKDPETTESLRTLEVLSTAQ